ncbi:catalase [Phaeobacter inhibens]|uniref:catalase n=1 Tax=Phaeobacter inhibens TaxID=221822 RepID=UPI000C9A87B8|nr:catalase [Phaeobacter inhibens]AUQ55116.1 Catalase [Phaeobacter inhibens]AUQ71304.1 Catalase [Phaeobacter inhibens]AUQ79132.1 Catalase [Phaeobacter inhibens]AUR04516.1 Catalase [Phaeobacter inhibens]AUR16291.1 Catalase [Phaeobacter inhibens]
MSQAIELIDALNGTFGRHSGARASHAKGFSARGRFIPAAVGPETDIPLLAEEQPIVARFSVGGGKPGISDKSPTVRGIGLEIGKGAGAWAMALISNPVFFANSAEQFKAFLAARVADPATGGPDPEKVKAFNEANPNTVPHQSYLKSVAPCRCYSAEQYHSGHAYHFGTGEGVLAARILLEPEGGRHGLTDEEKKDLPDDFLYDRLLRELSNRPARWTLKLVVANDADDISDPTVPWDGVHGELILGTVQIELPDDRAESVAKVFDPSHLPEGVAEPRDNVFALRSPAYAVSVARRSS